MRKVLLTMLCAVFIAMNAMADGTIPFNFQGLQANDKAKVTVSSEAYLETMTITQDGDYAFKNVPAGKHYIKVEASGYNVQDAQIVIVKEDGTIEPMVGFKLAVTKMEENSAKWTHSWHEDGSVSGYTTTAHVNTPPEVEFLGKKIVPSDVPSFSILQNEYKVLLVDEEETWSQEYAYRLVETFKTLSMWSINYYYGLKPAKFILTSEALPEDISVTDLGEGTEVRISTAAFQYANPFLVNLDGVRGKYYSKRLHHALVNFVTDYGKDTEVANHILRERFGCQVLYVDYEELTRGTTDEDAGKFQPFVPSELVSIINMFEELPEGFHKTPHLNYLIRRQNGHPHPLLPEAAAVAWCVDNGYIEFMETAFGGNNEQSETLRIILHEKTHFLWAYTFSDEIRNDWIEVGGWYPDPNAEDGWSTTKDTEFVSAYSHKKNPNEDMAESVAYYLKNPEWLQSRAPEKYDFIRDRIMHGVRYISKIPDHLTFEVLNLYPDYDYPGKIKRLDVTVEGEPEEDKTVTVEIELNNLDGYDDGASQAYLRMTSPIFYDEDGIERSQFYDLYLNPVDGNDHVLRGALDISRYSKAGYWTTSNIGITDLQGNQRYDNRNDFAWNMYVNNALEDVIPPKYESGSLTYEVTDTVVDGHQEQNLRASYKLIDNVGIATVFCRMNVATDYSYDAYGVYDPVTQMAHIDIPITEYHATGDYYVEFLMFRDFAGTDRYVNFSDSPLDEPRKTIHITTPNPDTVAPELDLNRMFIYAEPTHPEAPDGETIVTLTCYVRDDKSGLHIGSGWVLKDPQGGHHMLPFSHRNDYTRYFDGDPTVWERYTVTAILPQGSAPGIWGLAEMLLHDKAGNARTYNFVETIIFEPDDSDTDYILFADIDENDMIALDLTSDTQEGYGYQYRVISDDTGQEISGVISAGQEAKARMGRSGDHAIDVSDWPDGKIIVIVQVLDKEGNVVAVRSKSLAKSSETRKAIDIARQKAAEVYQNYVDCAESGMPIHQQMTEVQATNSDAAAQILGDIKALNAKITESHMTDEDKNTFLAALTKETESVSALQSENDGILDGNTFYEQVQTNSEAVTAFHNKINLYEERMKTASTIEALNALKAEIEQDAEDFESAYLNPMLNDLQDMERKQPRLAEIAKELEEHKTQLQAQEEEVDAIILQIAFNEAKEEVQDAHDKAMSIYQTYMSYAEGDGMAFYQQVTKEQATNSGTAVQILSDIKALESKIDESGIANEDKNSLLAALHSVKDIASALQAENDGILDGNTFYNKVQEHSEAVTAFYGRLKQYTLSIESAETIEELNTLRADIVQDFENFDTTCLTPVAGEHQALEPISPRLAEIAQELEDCKAKLQSQADVIDAIITDISTIGNDENEDVTVYTLNGLKQTMKRKELKSLPSGIYIINGKKYVTTRP